VNNGKTEYKNIVTAKLSTEILGPKQYSSSIGKNGVDTTYIIEDSTAVNGNGYTEITHFVLLETPTTTVTFTPTTIRGRKTSFSHVIPSTVYEASAIVSTVLPTLVQNAPLANILLSQLLLGNIGLQQQQPGLNPLLGLQPQQQLIPQMPATPVTEFKTRTTTYVTTLANGKSTVLPITFRGSKIYTTIYNEATEVITATEFITDTVVITPTQVVPQQQQLNSLLLPLLLQQQQQQQQQQPLNQANLLGLANINTLPNSFDILNREALESLTIPDEKQIQSVKDEPLPKDSSEDYSENYEEIKPVEKVKPVKKAKKPKVQPPPAPVKQVDTSVITLYISGRRPGEFSTVLSTITSEYNPIYKRSASYVDVKPSAIPKEIDILEAEASDNFYEYVLAGSDNDINPERRDNEYQETESLEVVLGNFNQYTSSIIRT
jgi:hypothetical protein